MRSSRAVVKARVNGTKKTETPRLKEEINKGPTADNGVGASSLEIRTGNFSKSVTYGYYPFCSDSPE